MSTEARVTTATCRFDPDFLPMQSFVLLVFALILCFSNYFLYFNIFGIKIWFSVKFCVVFPNLLFFSIFRITENWGLCFLDSKGETHQVQTWVLMYTSFFHGFVWHISSLLMWALVWTSSYEYDKLTSEWHLTNFKFCCKLLISFWHNFHHSTSIRTHIYFPLSVVL